MLNKIKLSSDSEFISIYSFKVYRAENFLIVPRSVVPDQTLRSTMFTQERLFQYLGSIIYTINISYEAILIIPLFIYKTV